MQPEQALERMGGVADAALLLSAVSRSRLRAAVARGDVVRLERGRYSLPGVDQAISAAHRLSGLLREESAAQYYGWELKRRPSSPCIVVPRHRKVANHRRRGVRVRFADVPPEDVNRMATSPVLTVLDCASRLPFDEALAIADSALRHRDVSNEDLLRRAEALPSRYRSRCLRVVAAADARAANPFESVLRAISLEVPGLTVVPQVWISGVGRPDLVDERLRLVIEADSFEFHGRRRALKHDCERYNALAVRGWLVVRFAWEHVMFEPALVRETLAAAVIRQTGQPLGQALEMESRRRSA